MKNNLIFNLTILLFFYATYLKADCNGTTLDNSCFFTIEKIEDAKIKVIVNGEEKEKITKKVTIKTSFDLSQYHIIFFKMVKYDDEGRPIKQLFNDVVTLSAGTTPIKKEQVERIDLEHFSITGSGHYQIKLKVFKDDNEDGIDDGNGDIHWKQIVYVPYLKPANYFSLAKKYVPIIVFGKNKTFDQVSQNEEYLPRNINDIFVKAGEQSTITIKPAFGAKTYTGLKKIFFGVTGSVDIKKFLTDQGNSDFLLTMDQDIFKAIISKNTDKPVVYFDVIETDKFIYLSYYYIYAFDPKNGTSLNVPLPDGAHSLDRESLIITLDKTRKPLSVTYGSHLAGFPIDFFGCKNDDFINCEKIEQNKISTINKGKIKLNWDNIHKQGNHLVAYAAKGSHALFPSYGWYKVINNTEIVGNTDTSVTWYSNQFELIEINLTSEDTAVFAFSGFWINAFSLFTPVGIGNPSDSKFPPFIRNPETWAIKPNINSGYDDCFSGNTDTTIFDCPRLKKYFPEVPTGIDGVLIKGRITNFANTGFGNDLILHYSGTDIEEILDASGNFSFIVRIAQLKETTDLELNDNLNNLGVIKGNQTRYYHVPDNKLNNIAVGGVIDLGDLNFLNLPVGQSIIGCI